MPHPNSPEEQLEALRQTYASQLSAKLRLIEETCEKLFKERDDKDALKKLHYLAHSLAGSGATFGFSSLSRTGSALENFVSDIIENKLTITGEHTAGINNLLDELRKASDKSEKIIYSKQGKDTFPEKADSRPIFIVDDDADIAQAIASQLISFGYTVQTFTDIAGLEKAMPHTEPAAIIMDIIFPEGEFAGTDIISQIRLHHKTRVPVIFVSVHDDMEARLRAVRADSDGYFVKPVDIYDLIDILAILTNPKDTEPYRILIVEDEPELAKFYSLILEQAGIITSIVTEPLTVMQNMLKFNPDLILMDIYMPDCSGMELARIIRQIPEYLSVPIVFLSIERNLEKKLTAMGYGGDDFLTKPIQPVHLISAVTTRVERARALKNLMIRDSMTGLLNHSNILENLEREVSLAKRQTGKLAFAMLDIDNFKDVNDAYGHLTGDLVLKSLARLLQDRLRKTDLIGRYGGEEFAVILLDTDGACAGKILGELKDSLSQIRYQSGGAEFSITFSCGLAAFPAYEDPEKLILAADKALYKAKHAGRDRIILAE